MKWLILPLLIGSVTSPDPKGVVPGRPAFVAYSASNASFKAGKGGALSPAAETGRIQIQLNVLEAVERLPEKEIKVPQQGKR